MRDLGDDKADGEADHHSSDMSHVCILRPMQNMGFHRQDVTTTRSIV